MNNILYGFEFGIGFFSSFFIVVILVFKYLWGHMKHKTDVKRRNKLTLEMLSEYLKKITDQQKFEEAQEFEKMVEAFKNKQPMDDFFKKYQIDLMVKTVDDEDRDEDDILSSFKKVYFIKRKED